VSTHEALLSDPALHRALRSLMKNTFFRLLAEFKKLGSKIVWASFNRIVVATNKTHLSSAMEYINFVISTIYKRGISDGSDIGEGLARLSLCPNNFYSNYLFLDEHNFGGILLETQNIDNISDESTIAFKGNIGCQGNNSLEPSVISTVVSGWNIMYYLGSELSREYFRVIVARFSKDVFQKQLIIMQEDVNNRDTTITGNINIINRKCDGTYIKSSNSSLVAFKKNLVSKDFASCLTRAVGEIIKDGGGPESFPLLPGSHLTLSNPVLEFVKSVLVILELDPDVYNEVQRLKKSLFAQIGVKEYSPETKWSNPCASVILPDVFCMECHNSRDVDLCVLPPPDDDESIMKWVCDDCGTPFDPDYIEQRLVKVVDRKLIRYQLQDLRCIKTGNVSTSVLSRQSESADKLLTDISRKEILSQCHILKNLARFYHLEWLEEILSCI